MQVYSYVLAFEVLDNLPHDCVVQREDQEEWREVTVEQEAHGSLRLSERQLQDELIKTVLTSAHWGKTGMITNSKSLFMFITRGSTCPCSHLYACVLD